MAHDGADIIDVGGESTRPGALPVSAETEIDRVVPVIRNLKDRLPDTLVSVDTCKVRVAVAALNAGADLVNDVSAGAQTAMMATVASFGAGIVLMHMRGQPRDMQENTAYSNVTAEVHAFLSLRAHQALEAGLPRNQVWLDPGIGFGKDDQANVRLLADLPDLGALGHPVLLGVSRKSMIGRLTGTEVEDRLPGSLAALTPVIALPQAIVRVHDPRARELFYSLPVRLVRIGPALEVGLVVVAVRANRYDTAIPLLKYDERARVLGPHTTGHPAAPVQRICRPVQPGALDVAVQRTVFLVRTDRLSDHQVTFEHISEFVPQMVVRPERAAGERLGVPGRRKSCVDKTAFVTPEKSFRFGFEARLFVPVHGVDIDDLQRRPFTVIGPDRAGHEREANEKYGHYPETIAWPGARSVHQLSH